MLDSSDTHADLIVDVADLEDTVIDRIAIIAGEAVRPHSGDVQVKMRPLEKPRLPEQRNPHLCCGFRIGREPGTPIATPDEAEEVRKDRYITGKPDAAGQLSY